MSIGAQQMRSLSRPDRRWLTSPRKMDYIIDSMRNNKIHQPIRLPRYRIRVAILMGIGLIGIDLTSCGSRAGDLNSLAVTATAYTSHPHETDDTPVLTAWGDTLKPGMKAIAVSRDLIDKGLTYGTKVSIEGVSGTYTVRDKMHKRWHRKIDIYMGEDQEAARKWGKRTVIIRWGNE